jgi:hypothetical protein
MEEVGRWFTWFLEDRGQARYQRHRQDVMQEAKHLAWRALIAIVVDIRDYPEAKDYPTLFSPFHSAYPPAQKRADWIYYQEVSGKGQWLAKTEQGYTLTLQTRDRGPNLVIPLGAIVSYRSTGFPKVAYNVEQFILGYQSWIDALITYNQDQQQGKAMIDHLIPYLIPENYASDIYTCLLNMVNIIKENKSIDSGIIKALETSMIIDMKARIPQQCKGIYQHALEWQVDSKILNQDSLIIHAYRSLREQYRSMVPGWAKQQ